MVIFIDEGGRVVWERNDEAGLEWHRLIRADGSWFYTYIGESGTNPGVRYMPLKDAAKCRKAPSLTGLDAGVS